MLEMKLPISLKIQQSDQMIELAGVEKISVNLDNDFIEDKKLSNSSWKSLNNDANISDITLSCSGVFSEQYTDDLIKHYAYKKQKFLLQIQFKNDKYIQGEFLIKNFDLMFDLENEKFQIEMINASAIEYSCSSKDLVLAAS